MGWIITNGEHYLYTGMETLCESVDDIDHATVFPHKRQAENALKNLGKSFRKLGYRVAETERPANLRSRTKKETEPSGTEKPVPQVDKEHYDRLLDAQYYIRELNQFRSFISEIQAAKPGMEAKQIEAEEEVEDILHAAEFYDLNEQQAYKLYLLLHEARLRRRRYKDAVIWITLINAAAPGRFLKEEPAYRIGTWDQRYYRPRALPQLFEELRGNEARK